MVSRSMQGAAIGAIRVKGGFSRVCSGMGSGRGRAPAPARCGGRRRSSSAIGARTCPSRLPRSRGTPPSGSLRSVTRAPISRLFIQDNLSVRAVVTGSDWDSRAKVGFSESFSDKPNARYLSTHSPPRVAHGHRHPLPTPRITRRHELLRHGRLHRVRLVPSLGHARDVHLAALRGGHLCSVRLRT